MRRRWWNPRMGIISVCLVMWLLHTVLKIVLTRYDIVSSIFAAHEDIPRYVFICTGIFVATRLFVVLIVPGLLAWRIVIGIMTLKGHASHTEEC